MSLLLVVSETSIAMNEGEPSPHHSPQRLQTQQQHRAYSRGASMLNHFPTSLFLLFLSLSCIFFNMGVHGFQHQIQFKQGCLQGLHQLHHHHGNDRQKPTEARSEDEDKHEVFSLRTKRRDILQHSVAAVAATSLALSSTITMMPPLSALAADSTTASSATTPTTFISPSKATITDKVFMNVRISRQDGTFYVRDDLPGTPENTVFYGRLVFGLFGKEAPRHVEKFKSYVLPNQSPLDNDPLPAYDRSTFSSFDQATGVLMGGTIASLELTELAGSLALRYGGRLLPASLWVESRSGSDGGGLPRISHSERGLLTHRQLEAKPDFGITTRSDTTMLDRTHTVFGRLLLDESSEEFLNIVSKLPTYGMERPNPINDESDLVGASANAPTAVDDAAAAVFKAQRNFFRNTAKTFGDSRLDKLYEGKLLRRVEVTSAGFL